MHTIANEHLLHQLNWRYATKQFDPTRKISAKDWADLEEALILTPSSFGLQPWKLIVVTDPAIRAKLVAVSYGQKQIVDASHLIVFAVKKVLGEKQVDEFMSRVSEVRGVPAAALKDYRDMMAGFVKNLDEAGLKNWTTHQAYIALGNFLTSAALLGIDACPMEGFNRDQYDEILGLNKHGLTSVVIATAGYRAATDSSSAHKKVRFPKEHVLVRI